MFVSLILRYHRLFLGLFHNQLCRVLLMIRRSCERRGDVIFIIHLLSSRRDVLGGGTRSAFEVISPRDTPAIQEQTAEEAVMYDDATPLPLAFDAGGGDSESDSKRVRIPRCPVCRVRKSAPCGSRAAPSRCYRRCMRDGWDSRDKCLQVPRRSAAAGRIHRQASTAAVVAQQARAAVQ